MTPVRLEPAALRSRVKHSTTEPLRSHRYRIIGLDSKQYIPLFRGLDNKDKIQHNIVYIFLSIFLTFTLGAQKNRLTETVLRVHARFLSGSKRYIFFSKIKSADICKDSDRDRAVTYLRIRHCSEVKNIEFDKKV